MRIPIVQSNGIISRTLQGRLSTRGHGAFPPDGQMPPSQFLANVHVRYMSSSVRLSSSVCQ